MYTASSTQSRTVVKTLRFASLELKVVHRAVEIGAIVSAGGAVGELWDAVVGVHAGHVVRGRHEEDRLQVERLPGPGDAGAVCQESGVSFVCNSVWPRLDKQRLPLNMEFW